MGVFIGWSGENTKSHKVALGLRRWFEQVVQGCDLELYSQSHGAFLKILRKWLLSQDGNKEALA